MSIVQPLPENWEQVILWFQSLDPVDLSNALLGAATVASLGFVLVVGLMLVRVRG